MFYMTIEQERRELDRQWQKLEREKKDFSMMIDFETRRMEREQELFDMKVKILEEELMKLAAEKKEVELKKSFYEQLAMREEESRRRLEESVVIRGEMFFRGVGNKKSLKKRYKDLIKIYHPDNLNGDKDTIQEINMEYEKMKSLYE